MKGEEKIEIVPVHVVNRILMLLGTIKICHIRKIMI